jgi:hypothetical protein
MSPWQPQTPLALWAHQVFTGQRMTLPPLQYLSFDESDDGLGVSTIDALASVLPTDLPAVQAEAQHVLDWAYEHWGAPDAAAEDGDQGAGWSYELQVGQEAVPHQPTRALLSITISAPTPWCSELLIALFDGYF